jgi:hypothetical protein
MNNIETLILVAIVLLVFFIVLQSIYNGGYGCTDKEKTKEKFSSIAPQKQDNIKGIDPDDSNDGLIKPQGPAKNYESLIFDNVTGTVMTGSQFMDSTGIIAPPWVAPAWNPDVAGPSSKGEIDPADYENDSRMLYNKCSLSCCSPQYPTPFQGSADPLACDKDGNNKYLASNYTCQNNTGGSGCLCMTQKQVDNTFSGFSDN